MSEWYGVLPERWETRKVNDLFAERREKVSDTDFAPLSVSKGGTIPQIANVAKTNAGDNRKLVRKGDFAINSRSDRRGSSGVSELDGSVSLINIVLTPRDEANGRYWHYLLKSYNFIEEYYRNGRGIVADLWTTRYAEMKSIYLPLPPRDEQDQIVRYLDWKVSRINKLVNAKRRQVALLQEQKRAEITEAVLSVHGTQVRLKRVVHKLNRSYKYTDEVVICSNSGKTFFRGNKKIGVISENDDIYQGVLNGDLMIHGMDTWHGAIAMSKHDGKCTTVAHVCDSKEDKRFIMYYLQMLAFRKLYKAISNGVRQNTSDFRSWGKAGDIDIVLPSLNEQHQISDCLDLKLEQIEYAISKLENQVSLLNEYRTRLISDVVTGKLDVRGVVVPEYEAVEETADEEIIEEEAEGDENAD
ncbi:MAG: restriction endonuclease subunit S [Planctomycetota bacterium]|jgi:type I restriction enzyme S subunit|nr:restriction endonuclease subunit S [Planctomycetota bacterium]